VLIGAGALIVAAVLYFMIVRPDGGTENAAAPSSSASSPVQPGAAAKSWPDSVAVVTSQDGATVRVRAESLSNCISVSHAIDLESGQTIPFERISSIDVLRADDHTSPNPKAQVRIQLLDGAEISGTVGAGCDLFGYNDTGRYTTYWDRIRRIQFER
jgi:serine/threonine-protein kinase